MITPHSGDKQHFACVSSANVCWRGFDQQPNEKRSGNHAEKPRRFIAQRN
jgi:hypothetical protein